MFPRKSNQSAEEIIKAAEEQAARIIREAKLITRRTEKVLEDQLHQTTKRAADLFEQALVREIQEMRAENQKLLTTLSEELTTEAKRQIAAMSAGKSSAEDAHLKRITEQVNQKLPDIIQDILGTKLTLEIHQNLIEQALEESKQDGLWKN